jgi:hypothetical protein
MAWGADPATERAAQEAAAQAQEAINRRLDAEAEKRLTPFERKLLGVMEDVRDALTASPAAGPASRLAPLLDADPADLGNALDSAELTVAAFLESPTQSSYRAIAEAVIDSALRAVVESDLDRHFETTPGQGAVSGGAAGADYPTAPAGHPAP